MFYILSKSLFFLIQPINWVMGCLLLTFFVKKVRLKRRFLGLTIILFFIFSNHFLYNQAMNWWEPEPTHINDLNHYEVGIVAGGYSNFFIQEDNGCYTFSQRASRLTQALELYQSGKFEYLLLSGGSGYMFGQEPSEAIEIEQFLIRMGVPENCILTEFRSRNTYENALYSKELIEHFFKEDPSILLITSAFHMPRTKACFSKQNLKFDVFPVDFLGEKTRLVPESILIPDRLGFYRWERLIKEWIGYSVYKIRGYL